MVYSVLKSSHLLADLMQWAKISHSNYLYSRENASSYVRTPRNVGSNQILDYKASYLPPVLQKLQQPLFDMIRSVFQKYVFQEIHNN